MRPTLGLPVSFFFFFFFFLKSENESRFTQILEPIGTTLRKLPSQISLFTEIWPIVNCPYYRLVMQRCRVRPNLWRQTGSDMDFDYIIVEYGSRATTSSLTSFSANEGALLGPAHGTCNGHSRPHVTGEIALNRQII